MSKVTLAILAVLFASPAFCQYEKGTKAIGGEIGFSSKNNIPKPGELQYNTQWALGINAGKFISKNNLLSALILNDYIVFKTVEVDTFFDEEITTTANYLTLKGGVMWRRYYPAGEKNIAGFTIQSWAAGGFSNNRWSIERAASGRVFRRTEDKNTNAVIEVRFSPGVYVNITSKWQAMFNFGNAYYRHQWGNGKFDSGYTIYGSSLGLDFNTATFRLSVTRFL